jgi:hypothetical protein
MNMLADASDDAFLRSSFIESLVEHVFISEVLQEVWYTHRKTIEVLRSEVDSSGYDIVFECNDVLRHVQLKTSKEDAKTARQKVSLALGGKPSGCVVWIIRHEDDASKRMKLTYLFFGNEPGSKLSSLDDFPVAKHSKGNAQGVKLDRPGLRVVPKRVFEKIDTTKELNRTTKKG